MAHFLYPDFDGRMTLTREALIELLEPGIEAMGFELTDIELNISHAHGMLRLFIDKENGISVEDCEAVSRQVSGILDVEDPIAEDYSLEVSSPGLNRKLVKPEHFDRFAGSKVKVTLNRLLDGRRRINGELAGRDGQTIQVKSEDGDISISLADIEIARLVPVY
jgi:ribosome maturation factor RimP